jgi:hypothetical protein
MCDGVGLAILGVPLIVLGACSPQQLAQGGLGPRAVPERKPVARNKARWAPAVTIVPT